MKLVIDWLNNVLFLSNHPVHVKEAELLITSKIVRTMNKVFNMI